MHLISRSERFFGGNAIVAAGIPQAVGLALASKKLKERRQTVSFFGEGAVAEGVFHESLNMAELWKIPVLFCCENNFYAMGTALSRSQAQLDIRKKAQAHNVASNSVDGMNVLEVIEKTKQALEFIEREGRPYLLEFRTYRFRPHSMFDPELYRSKEEVKKWKEKDPIQHLENVMKEKKIMIPEKLLELDKEIEKEMQEAVNFAENDETEPAADLEKYLYENELQRSLEGRT